MAGLSSFEDAVDPLDVEIQRQRSAWLTFVRGRGRRPTPTPAQRRMAKLITLTNSPRDELACAWAAADDMDRRDLIQKATGRAKA